MKKLGALSGGRCLAEISVRAALLAGCLAAAFAWPLQAGVPAALLIGILQYHFLILSHEAQHVLIARSKRWNDVIGAWFLSYPFGSRSTRNGHGICPTTAAWGQRTIPTIRDTCSRASVPGGRPCGTSRG